MQIAKINISDSAKTPSLIIVAALLNFAIFMIIQQLVSNEHSIKIEPGDINLVEFIRLKQKPEPPRPEQELEDIERSPPEQEAPPPPDIPEPQIEKPQPAQMDMALPEIDLPMSLSGTPYLGDSMKSTRSKAIGKFKVDTNVKPTLRIDPVYPPRALRSGIEGVVTVEFTIATDGSVKDAVIVKTRPPKIFDKAVLKAIVKWRFNPGRVDGKAVEKRARQDIKFKLQR